LVLLGFGALKFVPGASPAEGLVMRTVDRLTGGIVSGTGAVVTTAAVESLIGLSLITGIGLRLALVALAGSLVGFMSPIVLFFPDMFPDGTPTLQAQYILKDIILAAACAVVAARALGARYVTDGPPPTSRSRSPGAPARPRTPPRRPTTSPRRPSTPPRRPTSAATRRR
jgi:hypothetical protein